MARPVQTAAALLPPTGGVQAGGQPGEAVVGVDGHAGVLDQQVLQRAGLQEDGLAAVEAGWRRDEPALLQRGGVQVEEATPLLLLLILYHTVWVGLSRGVEGGAGGVADRRAGLGRGDHHQVVLTILVLRGGGRSREGVALLGGARLGCRRRTISLYVN